MIVPSRESTTLAVSVTNTYSCSRAVLNDQKEIWETATTLNEGLDIDMVNCKCFTLHYQSTCCLH